MFVMDIPPDMPAQSTPVVIAMASHDKKGAAKTDRTIGICHLIENQPDSMYSAVNGLSPVLAVKSYIWKQEHILIDKADLKDAKVSILQKPKHGVLKDEGSGYYGYNPSNLDYRGPDRATVLVEVAGRKVKVKYFFKVMQSVPGGTEGYKKYCPKGEVWKISLNPDDPNGSFFTFEQNYSIQNTLSSFQPEIVFADLPGNAVGQTIGNTITLDINAAGHGWFIDPTPGVNEEYVATSNPNEWVARVGSEASGKMDLLTVLTHEAGHVLGLPQKWTPKMTQ